ncbi:Uncharacterised protein [Yersinia pseudotuberculosis]|uniref:Uncharacterized protein n=1 Tax=Yersinia pseudotuberculosis serotype O:3 (strain YPIII) TaxID=502800 RepID=A0A0H3B2R3_YERPY|nr:hypothetical protein DJ40_1 [Yersinia pseudotuberculosis]AJJ59668.1 hypothetical protein BZ22_2421 [Yersinia pseudotuberculosis YPIII]AJJ08211.1 hypothetical protein BZ20_3946 [Yersinia pseudotuberculosis]CNH56205.1 Uncharacterised protein [Yersinia pseudotuberculosis]CNI04136.1 Uncharacterised protein [Yersinia pseudotuberculosis]
MFALAGRIQHCRPDSDNRIPCGYLLSMVGYQLFAINCLLSIAGYHPLTTQYLA